MRLQMSRSMGTWEVVRVCEQECVCACVCVRESICVRERRGKREKVPAEGPHR